MMKTALALVGLGALAFGAAACSKQEAQPVSKSMPAEMPSNMSDMPAQPATAAVSVQGTGTITDVDANGGTVTIDHGPIGAISWPAMNMQFKAEDPSILKGIAKGDRVVFVLKSETETGLVTRIQKQ